MWHIAGTQVCPGEKKQVYLQPPGLEGYEMPATVIYGTKPGKTLCITAGVHSGEYPGIPATAQMALELDPNQMSGQILLIHCVNVTGFWERSVSVVPEDGFNLNRGFPGDQVKQGQCLGHITDFFGHLLAEYHAQHDGTIFYHMADFPVRAGAFLIYYGA